MYYNRGAQDKHDFTRGLRDLCQTYLRHRGDKMPWVSDDASESVATR
jgi:tRNA nucleotidyltransferase/poly(A) polymerase